MKLLGRIVPPLPWLRAFARAGGPAVCAAGFLYTAGASGTSLQFSARVDLVEVYATVTGADGRSVEGLTAGDFVIEEDDIPQKIETFAARGVPLSVAVGLDDSFSVPPRTLAASIESTRSFVRTLSPDDQLMLIRVGSETQVLLPLSRDRKAAFAALGKIERWGTTPLYDAAREAVDAVQAASGRRALILVSDGVDRYSRTSAPELTEYVRRHDVLVYPVTTGRDQLPIWTEVATLTGGRTFLVRDPRELTPAFEAIASELRHQYLLGYVPAASKRSGWRSIRVRVNRPQLRVRARDGYLSAAK